MEKYAWKEGGPRPKIEAKAFFDVLRKLAKGGDIFNVKGKKIVSAARPRSSPIHEGFNWDDSSAGEQWRIEQARGYMRRLQIVRVETKTGKVTSERAFYSVRIDNERGYASADFIRTNEDLTLQVIQGARDELQRYINKYVNCLALSSYIPRINSVVAEMCEEIDRMAEAATVRQAASAKRKGKGSSDDLQASP